MENKQQNSTEKMKNTQNVGSVQRRPNETGSINVTGRIRIFDPQTQQTFVEKKE